LIVDPREKKDERGKRQVGKTGVDGENSHLTLIAYKCCALRRGVE
jgi:hypothetical protein